MTEHADILSIAGIDSSTFYNSGQDVSLNDDADCKPIARVFRKGGKLVYRTGNSIDWYDDQKKPS